MRCATLAALFFAVFSLFSTMAYAAPIAARQACVDNCRNAVADSPTSASSTGPAPASPQNRVVLMANIIAEILDFLSNGYNTHGASDLPPTTTAVSAAPSSTVTPASDPTGV